MSFVIIKIKTIFCCQIEFVKKPITFYLFILGCVEMSEIDFKEN